MNYAIKDYGPEMGRGLELIFSMPANKVLHVAELLVLSPEDTVKVNETDLKHYMFQFDKDRDCLVLGDGEIFNHSDTPNVGYKLMDWGSTGRKQMVFFTLRHIEAGEQLFIDYAADTKVNPKKYNVNLVG